MNSWNEFSKYCADFAHGVSSTASGMLLTITYFFRKKVTMEYPEVRPLLPENHRGLHRYDEDRCLVCNQCVRICPVNCITMTAIGRGKDKMIVQYDVDYSKCLFCNLCCEACTPECLSLTTEYDYAQNKRAHCIRQLARPKTAAEIAAFKNAYESRQAELNAKKQQSAKGESCVEGTAETKQETKDKA